MQRWVMFDLDGTLIESERLWGEVRREFVVGAGGTWREDAQKTMIGMRTGEWARYIREDLGVQLPPDRIAHAIIGAMVGRMEREVPVLPGATEALERVSAAFPLGLATSASRPVADAVLAKTGWNSFFKIVVSADEVQRGKPAPDVYLRALELAGADAQFSAAIEDSTNGIRAGEAAKMAVVAIPNREFPPDPTALVAAQCVLPSLAQLDREVIDAILPRIM